MHDDRNFHYEHQGRTWERGQERGREPRSFRGADKEYRFGRTDAARFDNDDHLRPIPIDETDRLISSDKVEGTRVFDRRGNRLGTIESFMVEKRSGRVEYAVLSFGGFLGMGDRHYPLPWDQLTYDERCGGYVVDVTERDLERAPSHRAGESPALGRGYGAAVNDYYMRYGW